ncbi:MAG: hypothetical protein K0S33_2649 [Bacteroidetes bacterium]|jgi:hypothetical protein|nr:hypothetical protein [Bacteroidota bacterium]
MKITKYIIVFLAVLGCSVGMQAQGLLNNGARIVMTNTSNIYINGATGHYTNQSGGLITSNTTGGVITLLGNWINNAANVAFSNDGVTTNFSGAAQSIGGSNSSTFFNVNLLGSGTKTLNINTTVGGISTLTGVLAVGARTLDLNSRTLTVTNPAGAGITYGTGMIQSETNLAINPSIVQWNMGTNTGAHVYPFGAGGTQIPFTFNKTTGSASNIAVSTRATAASNNLPWAGVSTVAAVTTMESNAGTIYPDASIPSVIDRWWDITASAAVTANLTFSYRGGENTTTNNPTGTMQAQHWNGTSWDAPVGSGAGVTAGVGTVSVTGASSFSPWVISSIMVPLPVELAKASGTCEKDIIRLEWTTAVEVNNNFFTIEHSMDGILFSEIGQIVSQAVNGNSSQMKSYSFVDMDPFKDVNYYRLQQTDVNGNTKALKVLEVKSCSVASESIDVYNQGEKDFTVMVNSDFDQPCKVNLHNALGQLVFSSEIQVNEGVNYFRFPMQEVESGMYFVTVSGSQGKLFTKKIIM